VRFPCDGNKKHIRARENISIFIISTRILSLSLSFLLPLFHSFFFSKRFAAMLALKRKNRDGRKQTKIYSAIFVVFYFVTEFNKNTLF